MTLLRPLGYPVGASQFPPALATPEEIALFSNPKVTDRFVPHSFGLGGNRWQSIKRRTPSSPTSQAVFNLVHGVMPTYEATGGPNAQPCIRWPVGTRAIFQASGITVPTALSGSFTVAAVYKPKANSNSNGILLSTLGTRGTNGITFWGNTETSGSYIFRNVTGFTGSRVGESNVLGSAFDDGDGKGWKAICWTRRGVDGGGAASLKTYYGVTTGGEFGWAENSITTTNIGMLNDVLMLGGSHAVGDPATFDGYSTSWDMAIADLIIMQGHDVIDDEVTLGQLGDCWFDKYFPV